MENQDGQPIAGLSDKEAPYASPSPTTYADLGFHYHQQQQQGQSQYLPAQSHLHTQQEEGLNNESDDGDDIFAYRPPSTADQSPQPHQIHHSQHQHQFENLSAVQLHNLVTAATSDPQLLSSLSSIPEFPLAPSPHLSHAHGRLPGTSSSGYEPGLNSYSMSHIPVGPGIVEPRHIVTAREPLHVALPATPTSSIYSVASPAHLERAPYNLNTSAVDTSSRSSTGSPISTEEDSPYIEVRASVSNMDDPDMPTMTFRVWFLGLTLVLVGSCLNTFFNFRYPAPFLTPSLVLLIAYPLGKALTHILPTRTWVLPQILGGWKFTLNPGPFNVKEHVLIYMMANAAITPAYVMNVIVVAEQYYGLDFGPGFAILLVLATTLTGFGLAGICRTFLVWPTNMVWPQNLVSCTLLNTLHEEDKTGPKADMSRYRFFLYAILGIFLWTFLPGFLFVGLSFFSWVCWITPSAYPYSPIWEGD